MVFLFDEPLSNLDAKMRVAMRMEIRKLHLRLQTTMIYVTHDQTEAMTMADRIVVMNKASIQQVADPLTVYNHPANLFVAGFIGSPPMNLIARPFLAFVGRLFSGHVVVRGDSMSPTLRAGSRLAVDRLAYLLAAPHRGDVVVVRGGDSEKSRHLKRVVGLPGEEVAALERQDWHS